MQNQHFTFLMYLLLSLFGAACATRTPQEVFQLPRFERPDLPHYAIRSAWEERVGEDIRRDYLVDELGLEKELALQIVRQVNQEADSYDLNPNRLLALIIVESYGNPKAVSPKGAVGLMQILPSTGQYIAHNLGERWKGIQSLKAVETNISFGVWYYQYLLRTFQGDIQAALAAYNWGPGEIIKRRKRGQALPKVYPGKIKTIRKELDEVLRYEYKTRFWGSFDSFVHRTRNCYDSGRSAPECGVDWAHIPDGESLFPGYREGVFAADSGVH